MRLGDMDHADPCRKCYGVFRRSEMVRAAKVKHVSNARGYYCQTCARSIIELEQLLKKAKGSAAL